MSTPHHSSCLALLRFELPHKNPGLAGVFRHKCSKKPWNAGVSRLALSIITADFSNIKLRALKTFASNRGSKEINRISVICLRLWSPVFVAG
jgi:hypothetical protein